MRNEKAIFPGSFNPFHNGHLEVLAKASSIFSEIIIYVANNEEKEYSMTISERTNLIKKVIEAHEIEKVKVIEQKEGEFTPIFAKEQNIKYIVRGIKNEVITDNENKLMKRYKEMNPKLDFVFINTELEVSSSMINKLIKEKGDISLYVSDSIVDKLI